MAVTVLTSGELRDACTRMLKRLSRHLDSWDAGEVDAAEDVAAVSRTLLAMGKGDRLISRLRKQEGLDDPILMVHDPHVIERRTLFAVGNLPASPDGMTPSDARKMTLTEWLSSRAVFSVSASRRETSWHQLVTDIGNTYGSHVSQTVPDTLSEIALYGGPSGNFRDLMLRSAAIVAENALQELLVQLGLIAAKSSSRELWPSGTALPALRISSNALEFVFRPNRVSDEHLVARLPVRDQTMEVWSLPAPDGASQLLEFRPLL